MTMIDDTLGELKTAIQKITEVLKRDLARIRTGRANPDILDSVRVEYWGSPTPLKQMASISVPEARLIVLKPFERGQIAPIEKAILEAQLGLNPMNDGELIRIPMPQLSEERRKELTKVARKAGEEAKVALRKARHEAKDMLDALESEGEAGADEVERAGKKLEEIVKAATGSLDTIVQKKEADILEV